MARRKDMDRELPPDRSGGSLKQGRATPFIGPSDSSDSGSDMMGIDGVDNTSDRHGTGERASAAEAASEVPVVDIAPDRIVDADGAGLGEGLDQAEEARLGVTDEEMEAAARADAGLDD
jgi:hypothetical protein